jgi:lysozyme
MKLSKEGLNFLKREEGVVPKVYKDQAGLLTAGVGHLLSQAEIKSLGLKNGMMVSMEQVDKWLAEDVSRFEAVVSKFAGFGLSQTRFDALVVFAFNVGVGAYGLSVGPLVAKGNYTGAAAKMKLYDKATVNSVKVVLPVLVARRKREIKLLLTGDYR